jgi:hypothetical protein
MPDTTTIFLSTDGRHTTLGRGDAVEASDDLIAAAAAAGIAGWVAILTGRYYGKRKVTLARVHGVNGADDSQWDAAVAAFDAIRCG